MNFNFLCPSRIVWQAGAPAQPGMLMDDPGLDTGGLDTGGFDKDAADPLPLIVKAAVASSRTSGAGRGIRLLADTSRDMTATGVAAPDRKVL